MNSIQKALQFCKEQTAKTPKQKAQAAQAEANAREILARMEADSLEPYI